MDTLRAVGVMIGLPVVTIGSSAAVFIYVDPLMGCAVAFFWAFLIGRYLR